MPTIDEILRLQEQQLLKLEEREVREFLRTYHGSRRELRDRLDALSRAGLGNRWTAQSTRVALVEVEDGLRVLRNNLRSTLGGQVLERRDISLRHLMQTIGKMEPDFPGAGGVVNVGALKRLNASGELLMHRFSVDRYSADLMDRIQAEIARAHASKLPRSQVVQRIVGTDRSVFSGMEHRAALIDRMENARAYDAAFREGLAEANALTPELDDEDPMLKKAMEFIDKRSHPFSEALDGRVAREGGEWEVPAADVEAAGRKMKKGTSGVLWRLEGRTYRGASYPAHFNDRGRAVPWRPSWGPFKGSVPPK